MPAHKKICILLVFISFTSLHSFYSCKKNDLVHNPGVTDPQTALDLPATTFNYANPLLPAYLRSANINDQDNTPATNPVTDAGATLGRVLFYDKTLSINNTIACASCHKQTLSFADDKALSVGFAGELTARNAMTLVNTRYYPKGKFLWDERGTALETQTLLPIQDHVEMGMTLDTLVNRLKTKSYYPELFFKAFGTQTITSDKIGNALAQFIRSIVSYQSKFDEGRSMINSLRLSYPNFTDQENEGKQLFFNAAIGCNSCHGSETFTAPAPKNNGLENPSIDQGVGAITNNPLQMSIFKVPSIKNIELTAPYMHDGRFKNLEEVIEHYNSGIEPHPNLPPTLRNLDDNTPKRLNLTADQKAALISFLKTLTDRSITSDVKFSNPFIN
jgi:cytochrome c peroxidase